MQDKKRYEIRKGILIFISIFILISTINTISATKLPTVGGDSGAWGTILNEFLNVSHNGSGELRSDIVFSSQIVNGTITDTDISDITNLTLGEKITFTFGEIIDNIVNGWIKITGGLNVTQNFTVGSSALFVDSSSGNVGIGTDSPTHKLNVVGDINITGNLIVGDDISLEFGDWVSEQNPDGYDAIRLKATVSDVDIVLAGLTGYFNIWGASDNNVFSVDDDGDTDIIGDFTLTVGDIIHGGVRDPWVKKAGDIMTGNLNMNGNGIWYAANGSMGINTTTPDSIFHIKANFPGWVGNNYAGQIIIQNPANSVVSNVVITAYESDGSGNPDQQLWYLGSSSTGNSDITFLNRRNAKLQLGTSGTSRITILGNGNVGIGTTSPDSKLQIDGNFTSETDSTDSIGTLAIKWLSGFFVNLFVSGNINATGIVYGSNLFIPQYLFSHTNENISVLGAGTWTNITFSEEATAIMSGISHTYNDNSNQTFTMQKSGIYEVDYDLDVEDLSGASTDVDVAGRLIYTNGTEVSGSVFETDVTKKGISTEVSHDFLVSVQAGDSFIAQFTASDGDVRVSTHGSFGDHPESATITIKKIANL